MSLYAFQPLVPVPASLMRYDDLPRRLLRLAHIAGVMLPLINVVTGVVVSGLSANAGSALSAASSTGTASRSRASTSMTGRRAPPWSGLS